MFLKHPRIFPGNVCIFQKNTQLMIYLIISNDGNDHICLYTSNFEHNIELLSEVCFQSDMGYDIVSDFIYKHRKFK